MCAWPECFRPRERKSYCAKHYKLYHDTYNRFHKLKIRVESHSYPDSYRPIAEARVEAMREHYSKVRKALRKSYIYRLDTKFWKVVSALEKTGDLALLEWPEREGAA